jgi:pSer/pThr/pTyr-binding forkhead associated (FHA) protein
MPSPRFPATATLLDTKICPLEKFDALFTKITQERQIPDGYFLQNHPEETSILFVVNRSPYGAGRLAGGAVSFLEIHEFFAAYARHPQSPLSFLVADKRLLLGLMVLFRHRPALQFTTDLVDMEEVLRKLEARGGDAIVGIRAGDEWAITICAKGKPVGNYFPPSGAEALKEPTTAEQLLVYVFSRPPGGVTVDVYEETRVSPAGDATLVTPERRGHLSEVYLAVAKRVEVEEAPRLELERPVVGDVSEERDESFVASAPRPERVEGPPAAAPVVEASLAAPLRPEPVEGPPPVAPATAAPVFKGPIPEVHLFLGEKQLGTFSMGKGELTIGRNPGNDILIENVGVSRRHAIIKWTGDHAVVEDLGSANGTFVNGQKITSRPVQDGDEILVLKHRLVYRIPKEAAAPKLEMVGDIGQRTMYIDPGAVAHAVTGKPAGRPEAAGPKLRPCLILPDRKKMALEAAEITLGSGPDCQIKLSGMLVAKVHARIIPDREGQYKLVHLAGLAGTRVNGEKITEHILRHGDEIEIAKQKLLFRLER